MKDIKSKVKKDLKNNLDVNLEFDTSELEDNPKRKPSVGKIIGFASLGLVSCLTLVIAIPLLAAMTNIEDKYKVYQKDYSIHELQKIKESSFKLLNQVDERNPNTYYDNEVSLGYKDAVKKFANMIYSNIDVKPNISFSPYGLYSNLSIMSLASDNSTTLNALDNVLGFNKESRRQDFINVYLNDFYSNEFGTLQFYNASFQSNKWDYNQNYIDELTRYMVEAYQLDFSNELDISKMLDWVDQRMNDKSYLLPSDLELDEYSSLFLFTTMYFNNKWMHSFETSETYTDKFYVDDNQVDVSYMKHIYFGDCYDYGDYVSCYDYYANKSKIKYLIPKDTTNKSIYDLIGENNIFIDDETKKITLEPEEYDGNFYEKNLIINLSIPKFETDCLIDFNSTLTKVGLGCLYNPTSKSFNYAFNNLVEGDSMYLSFVKQKNKVSFSEDGTVVKSVTFSAMKSGAAGPMTGDTIDIKLDRPFIYIIYDGNDIPIYVGNMDNPKL